VLCKCLLPAGTALVAVFAKRSACLKMLCCSYPASSCPANHPITDVSAAAAALLHSPLPQVSALPVVNEGGVLQDIYARADITKLCKGNAYNRLQWEDVTVREGGAQGRHHCIRCALEQDRKAQVHLAPWCCHRSSATRKLVCRRCDVCAWPVACKPVLSHWCCCLPLLLLQVGQALSLSNPNPAAWSQASAGSGGHLLVPDFAGE
jgi:hypothetical protein